ncbi:MAG: HypC/HybG/HupF family hydrogenase formation chaperone [Candidatus Bipolaricaulaceae bacterium]
MCLAIPVRVVAVEGGSATVDVGGSRAKARLDALGEPVQVGDYVLVHAGFAIRRLDPADAEETLRLWDELLSGLGNQENDH